LLGEVLTFDKYDQDVDEKEKEEEKKKKTMAFKATSSKGKTSIQEEDDNKEDEELEINDETLALVVKNIDKIFIKRRGLKKRNKNFKSNDQQRKCFNCDSTEHL
jgi:hypothetical protein